MSSISDDQSLFLGPLPKPTIFVPSKINKYLKPCQQNVVRFLYTHYFQKDGGILSDKRDLHDVLPLVVFISSLIHTVDNVKVLLIINEETKDRLNLWLNYFSHVDVEHYRIKYCATNETKYCSEDGRQPCIYFVKAKRCDAHIQFFKKNKWTLIIYDNFDNKHNSLTNILNSVKDLTSECRFVVSRESIFHSNKYFWSLFQFIGKTTLLAKTWKEFDQSEYKHYFNKVDRDNSGHMTKIDIYKTLEATRIRFEYVSRNVECSGDKVHENEPWSNY
uniref:SNF2 N-terminal domain-containing protein n=1 Tax=Cacopsylla melanoneura TaxID=428564 RepID=A0A8D8TZX4_9HEMI